MTFEGAEDKLSPAKVSYLNGWRGQVMVEVGEVIYYYPNMEVGSDFIPNRAYALHQKLKKKKLVNDEFLTGMGLIKGEKKDDKKNR